MRRLALLPLLCACRYEPLGWWDIETLSVSVEGGDTLDVDDAGFVEISSEGGDYAHTLIRYILVPNLENSITAYPAADLTVVSGNWEMDGSQDFSLFLPIGETAATFTTDHTLGPRLSLASADPVTVQVPSTWTGEEQGTGAFVTADFALDLRR